jgi:hypothetical protein
MSIVNTSLKTTWELTQRLPRLHSRECDGAVDFFPERVIRGIGESCREEGLDAVELKVFGVNFGKKSRQIASEIFAAAAGRKEKRGVKAHQCVEKFEGDTLKICRTVRGSSWEETVLSFLTFLAELL